MQHHRRQVLKLAASAVAAPLVSRVAWGQAPQVTLKMTHFVPPIQNAHSKLLAPWARKVEAESGGRIKIDIFPAMGLGGTPAQLSTRCATALRIWSGRCRATRRDGSLASRCSSFRSCRRGAPR